MNGIMRYFSHLINCNNKLKANTRDSDGTVAFVYYQQRCTRYIELKRWSSFEDVELWKSAFGDRKAKKIISVAE